MDKGPGKKTKRFKTAPVLIGGSTGTRGQTAVETSKPLHWDSGSPLIPAIKHQQLRKKSGGDTALSSRAIRSGSNQIKC